MKTNFKFSNLLGTCYKQGNLLFTPDGNTLISPVGNRISVYDLKHNKAHTLPFETNRNIQFITMNNDLILLIDMMGHALLINFMQRKLISKMKFKNPNSCKFSLCGKFIAVGVGSKVELYKTPIQVAFQPFVLVATYTGHYDDITSISWSRDSTLFLTTSKDMTTRIHSVDKSKSMCLTGHNDVVVGAWFGISNESIYSCSRDGALYEYKTETADAIMPYKRRDTSTPKKEVLKYKAYTKNYFEKNSKVICCDFHTVTGLLIVGFANGIFGIWELPDFLNIQTLSISQDRIDSCAINSTGEWLAFGSQNQGQLLVWEWQSESYIIKQQGTYNNINCLDYTPDGQFIATGSADGKLKIWQTDTGFCFVTFSEHSGSILDLIIRRKVVFSCGMDGTVRAFDLVRYRNFKTFTAPTPEQFNSLSVDISGEILVASSNENFDIYMWSVQTGKLLEIISGHEAPISRMIFTKSGQLVSGSWDHTIRIWDIYSRNKGIETLEHPNEVLTVEISPDDKIVCAATLDGNLNFWDLETSKLISTIEGRKDITGGRSSHDKISLQNSGSGQNFNTVCFSADGKAVLAGGNSKYICLYDIDSKTLLKRFVISNNMSLDRMREFLNSKNMTEAGPKDLIDQSAEYEDLQDRIDKSLPGVVSGDASLRKTKPEARTLKLKFSPAGREWSAATTEGLLVYALDSGIMFDPFDLDLDITPKAIASFIENHEWTKAVIASYRLGEQQWIERVYHQVPLDQIPLVLRSMGSKYFEKFLVNLVHQYDTSPRIAAHLKWTTSFLEIYAPHIKGHAPILRALRKQLTIAMQEVASLCEDNCSAIQYLSDNFEEELEVTDVGLAELGL